MNQASPGHIYSIMLHIFKDTLSVAQQELAARGMLSDPLTIKRIDKLTMKFTTSLYNYVDRLVLSR